MVATVVALILASGWAVREYGHAQEKAKYLASGTLTADQVKVQEATFEGKPTGKLAVYYDGNTPGTRNFVSGRFELRPGTEPHPPHVHAEEEILIVASGKGEIFCDGKTTPVGPGTIMYTAPNVSHSIKNTGSDTLVFYWVKWIGVGPKN
jgi:mannose-6-phosphate isomerase-like protein (cupin superfamily)